MTDESEFQPGSEVRPWIEDERLCGSVETTDDEVILKILVDSPPGWLASSMRFRQEYEGRWTPPDGPS